MGSLIFIEPQRQDLDAIMEIEKASFVYPWDVLTVFSTMNAPYAHNRAAFLKGQLAGYCFAHEMSDMIHLLNLAVKPDLRGMGIGRMLMEDLIAFAQTQSKLFIFLEVRRSNERAKTLYKSLGFDHVCTWRKYYNDTKEDADVMLKRFR